MSDLMDEVDMCCGTLTDKENVKSNIEKLRQENVRLRKLILELHHSAVSLHQVGKYQIVSFDKATAFYDTMDEAISDFISD